MVEMILMFTCSLEKMEKVDNGVGGIWVGGGNGQGKGGKTFLSSGSPLWKICPLSKYLAVTVNNIVVMNGGLLLACL